MAVELYQYFPSDADYIFYARSAYEQHYLHSSINFPIHKINLGTFTARIVKNNFKGTMKSFVASEKCIFIYEFSQRNSSILKTVFI